MSKNKETRTRARCPNYLLRNLKWVKTKKLARARDVPTICYEILLINARSFTHNQCLSKGLKNKEKSSC